MRLLLLDQPYFRAALTALGHEVRCVARSVFHDPRQPLDLILPRVPIAFQWVLDSLAPWRPDWIFLGDDSTFPHYLGLEMTRIPLAWYAVDTHIHHQWHPLYASAWDLIFVCQQDSLSLYQVPGGPPVHWLPVFSYLFRDRWLDLEPEHAISFVGNLDPGLKPERARFIGALGQRIPLHLAQGDYVEVFNRSHMVINQTAAGDLNFRVFEALACGTLLLTERIGNGQNDLLRDGEHLVLYEAGNVAQVVDLYHRFLTDEPARRRIARQGLAEVRAHHTDRARAEAVMARISALDPQAVVQSRLARLAAVERNLAPIMARAATIHRHFAAAAPPGRRQDDLTRMARQYQTLAETLQARFGRSEA
ncbi:MAG: glycosyltransferase [Magnetococcales bacterium]|nr:glycosyltransferase [Magnetococcales bacterium]